MRTGKKPSFDDLSNRAKSLISRIPLEDMRELWVWGSWKEPTPNGFSSHVFVVCTSRAACRHYASNRTTDTWLLADELGEEAAKPPVPDDDSLFDASNDADRSGNRRFRLLSFNQLAKEIKAEARVAGDHGVTLLVNPRRGSGRVEADAICRAADFLETMSSGRS